MYRRQCSELPIQPEAAMEFVTKLRKIAQVRPIESVDFKSAVRFATDGYGIPIREIAAEFRYTEFTVSRWRNPEKSCPNQFMQRCVLNWIAGRVEKMVQDAAPTPESSSQELSGMFERSSPATASARKLSLGVPR